MKGFVMGERMDAVRAAGQLNESVAGTGIHGGNLGQPGPQAKPKRGAQSSGPARRLLRARAKTNPEI
jgi:hypothetical protein